MGPYVSMNTLLGGLFGPAGSLLVRAVLFGLVNFAGAELGHFLSFRSQDQVFATFWPPAGLLVATLFLSQRRTWPILLLAACGADLVSDVLLHNKSVPVSLGFSLANSLEACSGTWLLGRFSDPGFTLRRMKDVLTWVFLSALPSIMVGATVGAATVAMAFSPASYWSTWLVWWVSNVLGVLMVAPLVFSLAGEDATFLKASRPTRPFEGLGLFAGLALVVNVVFGDLLPSPLAQPILSLPFLLWAGLRFGPRSSAAAVFVLTVVAVWHTTQGRGPFHVEGASLSQQALRVQTFLSVVSFCALALTATVAERSQVEFALAESETFLRLAQQAGHVGSWQWDVVANRFHWSEEFARMHGISGADFDGTLETVIAFCHPDDRSRLKDAMTRFLGGGEIDAFECRIRRRDGAERCLWFIGHAYRDALGAPSRLIGVAIDITERKCAEEALRQSEERYRLLTEHARVVLWECNPDTFIFSHVSQFAEQLLGFPRAEWYAPGFWAAHIHPEDREEAIAYCLRFTLAKQDHRFEYRMVRSDGQIVWVEDVVKVVIERETVVSMRGVLLDISMRKQAEEARRESEERFRSAFDFAAIGMALVAPDGRWLQVNRSLCDIVGYTEEELLARDFQSITHPEDLDTDLGFVRQMLDGSIPYYHMEKRYFHKQGGLVWILLSVSLLRDRRGEPLYFISQIQDITERKRAVETLHEYNLRLKALSHQILETQETERRRIARELHDEVGQMLTTIGLRLHQLKDVCGPEVHSALNQDISFVNRTIEQVRELSLNLRPPMLDVLGLEAALRWYAENQRQRTGLDVQLVGHLEGPRLDPDLEIACFRVVQEALTNIVRHAHAKRVWIELQEEDSKLHLVIHDDGIGFDVGAKRECAGRGRSFGVMAMQERVELLAGQFDLESAPGAGTWIRASFPLAAPSAPQTHLELNR